jgi:predicted nucleic acid-binding protein
MSVVFDASVLIPFFDQNADVALDPETNEQVDKVQERLRYLVQSLDEAGENIVVPTPALSELLVGFGGASDGPIGTLTREKAFRVVTFDIKAAVEAALMQGNSTAVGRLRQATERNRHQMKFDLLIVAIAKAEGAHTIYSDDKGMPKIAGRDIQVTPLARLPLPPEPP